MAIKGQMDLNVLKKQMEKTALAVSRRQSDGRFVSRDDQLAAIKAVDGTTKVVFVNG